MRVERTKYVLGWLDRSEAASRVPRGRHLGRSRVLHGLLRCPMPLGPKDEANLGVKGVIVSLRQHYCITIKLIGPRYEGRSVAGLEQVKRPLRHLEASVKLSNRDWTRRALIVT
jgi:hypothetical protein